MKLARAFAGFAFGFDVAVFIFHNARVSKAPFQDRVIVVK